MSKYQCSLYKELWDAYVETELLLDPADYLDCETVEEMLDAVLDDLEDSVLNNCIYWTESAIERNIPDEFIEEWKSLKHLNLK